MRNVHCRETLLRRKRFWKAKLKTWWGSKLKAVVMIPRLGSCLTNHFLNESLYLYIF
jgi:hypothetical protein